MAETMEMFVGVDPYVSSEPRFRLREFLRRKFPAQDGFAVKKLAQTISCTTKTAENILAGHWPNSRHMQRIVQTFGSDAIDAVFGPDIDATLARAREAERKAEEAYELAKARTRSLRGAVALHESGVAAGSHPAELNDDAIVVLPLKRRAP